MSVVTLQFGQCGNQIGNEFYSMLATDEAQRKNNTTQLDRWFRRCDSSILNARAVLVDTEQKVLQDIAHRSARAKSCWVYDSRNFVSLCDGGAANNWAFGYNEKGPKVKDKVMECIRSEVEKCDMLESFLTVSSSAGGTGSGVGSFIIETLKDEYPTKYTVSSVILPYKRGEVVTQNYNTLLTFARLYDVADIHFIFQNDQLYKMVSNLVRPKDICMKDLNSLISLKLMAVLQPVENNFYHNICDIVTRLVPHPGLKFVSVKSAPHVAKDNIKYESTFHWESLIRHMLLTLHVSSVDQAMYDSESKPPSGYLSRHTSSMQFARCISNVLFTRGTMSESLIVDKSAFSDPVYYKRWVPDSDRYLHCHSNEMLMGIEKFIALVSNNSLMLPTFNELLCKAWNMYNYRAYVHQYKKYGVDENDFTLAFARMESVVKQYGKL